MKSSTLGSTRFSAGDIDVKLLEESLEIAWPDFGGPYIVFINGCEAGAVTRPARFDANSPRVEVPFNGQGVRFRARAEQSDPKDWAIDAYIFQTRAGEPVVLFEDDLADWDIQAPTNIRGSDAGDGQVLLEWDAAEHEIVGLTYQASFAMRDGGEETLTSYVKTPHANCTKSVPDRGCRARVITRHPLNRKLRSRWSPTAVIEYVESGSGGRALQVIDAESAAERHLGFSTDSVNVNLDGDQIKIAWPDFLGPYMVVYNSSGENGANRPDRLLTEEPSTTIPFNANGMRIRIRSQSLESQDWTIDAYILQTRAGEIKVYSEEDLEAVNLAEPRDIKISDGGNNYAHIEWDVDEQELLGHFYQISIWQKSGPGKDGFSFIQTSETRCALPVPEEGCRIRVATTHPLYSRLRSAWSQPITMAFVESDKDGQTLRVSRAYERPPEFHQNAQAIRTHIEEKATVLDTFPLAMSVILEGRGCNLKCFYCSHIIPNATIKLNPKHTFTKEEKLDPENPPLIKRVTGRTEGTPPAMINQVVEHLPYVATLMFGGSEPTLYPEFRQMLQELRNHPHVQCSVCTNGTLLNDRLADEILASNFPWIRVSIDGASDVTFKKIRKGKFSKVINNLKSISDKRGALGTPGMQFNFVVCRSNYHEIVELVNLAHEVGVSVINYKMLISHGGYYEPFEQEDPLWDKSLCVEIIDLMAEAKARADVLGVRLTNEAVTPAIFTEFPELRSQDTRASVRQEYQANIDERQRLREEELDGKVQDNLQTLAEYVEARRDAGIPEPTDGEELTLRRSKMRANVENGAQR